MAKQVWEPCSILSPVPAVLVTVKGLDGVDNIMTAAWTGTVCSNPAMAYISVRKERFTHHILKETGEFVINLTTKDLIRETDYCGVKSGRDEDKFETMNLHKEKAAKVSAPLLAESPVNIECRVQQVLELGSHDMFLAKILAVNVDEKLLDRDGRLSMEKAELIAYAHGSYYSLGEFLGTFGYSVRKKPGGKH